MKIFQIGFNKTGTASLHNLFKNYTNPKLKSIHWDNGFLAYSIFKNKQNNKNLLDGCYEEYNFFSDMECSYIKDNILHWVFIYLDEFITLDIQYPNSKFILNIRDKKSWLKSRCSHTSNLTHISNDIVSGTKDIRYYIDSHKEYYKCKTYKEILDIWSNQYDEHIKNVTNYFQNRPEDLLVFDIEKDPFDKITNFFAPVGINFTVTSFPHINQTKL